ncbi:MAG: hypothetical protein LBC86_05105 [Oscillospiraceae bacterium]|jgi:hypothetical protein|nr:hypothetical protein [Oscillospiraceae bacterium]
MKKLLIIAVLSFAMLGILTACTEKAGNCDFCGENAILVPFKISDRVTADICEPCYDESAAMTEGYSAAMDAVLS